MFILDGVKGTYIGIADLWFVGNIKVETGDSYWTYVIQEKFNQAFKNTK